MKKVAIVTINDNKNYGNRLQNFALQTVLNDMRCDTTTIEIRSNIKEKILLSIKKIIKMILPAHFIKYKKEKNISKFSNKYIRNTKIKSSNISKLNNEFDFFIVGSDQVWNYHHISQLEFYFLPFVDYEKTASYAASFGVSSIEENYKEIIRDGLNHLKYISVREEQGVDIVKKLTGRNAELLLDPTLLLERNIWEKIEKKPKINLKRKYILTYFLGENIHKREIEKLSLEYELDIVNMCDLSHPEYYILGIEEFLYLFHNAELVFTDSFHACVFSIIYDKPFYVFDRKQEKLVSMNSRLDTFLKKIGQENRKVDKISDINGIFNYNYELAHKIIEKEKIKSLEFLKKIIRN